MANQFNYASIDLRNAVNRNEVVQAILNFNNQQQGNRHPLDLACIGEVFDPPHHKWLTFKKMLQVIHLKTY